MNNKLNNMIASSDIKLKTEHWFSREEQKKLVLQLSSRMVVDYGNDPDEAIDKAQAFVDAFYKAKMNPETWR